MPTPAITPTPWPEIRLLQRRSAFETRYRAGAILRTAAGQPLVTVSVEGLDLAAVRDHADQIGLAVNSHEPLVRALKGLLSYTDGLTVHSAALAFEDPAVSTARIELARLNGSLVPDGELMLISQ